MMSIIKKSRSFIVEEKDVTTVLDVINRSNNISKYYVGNCGWANEPAKWFVMFDVRDKIYGLIVKGLLEVGRFDLKTRPGGMVDTYFERA